MNKGKVWLVGAGPGDAGLLTIKGRKVLKQADVVVYDSLIGQGILAEIPDGVKLINAGKRANHHTMAQEEINEVLLKEALEGNRVVRLKGGDPFLFGRGGEELELLEENHISYEIVPGVTSAVSVPAYNGIPVTHRDFCSSVHIITGHKRTDSIYDIDYKALTQTGGTLVFLMGISSLGEICNGLMKNGMDPDMPAAVLQKGTTAGQKRIVATVGTLKSETDRQGVETPAIIVVGRVCSLADKFAWYEKLPLAGWKVLVTRPRQHISKTSELLRQKGAEVLELPSIATVSFSDQSALYRAVNELEKYQWLVFTSPTGVEVFFQEMEKRDLDARRLHNAKIAVIGQGTGKKLKEYHLLADFIPSVYDGETLGRELAGILHGGERILIPRAQSGNPDLVRHLEEAGGVVDDIPTYKTCYEKSLLIDEKKELESGSVDCVVFTSASTVKGFVEATKGLDYSQIKAACIGKQTKAAADACGMKTFMAEKATIESLVELVENMKKISDSKP